MRFGTFVYLHGRTQGGVGGCRNQFPISSIFDDSVTSETKKYRKLSKKKDTFLNF